MNRWRYAAKQDLKTGFINVIHQYLLVLQRSTVYTSKRAEDWILVWISSFVVTGKAGLFLNKHKFVVFCLSLSYWATHFRFSWVANFSWSESRESWRNVERLGVFKENISLCKDFFLLLFLQREFFNRGAVFPFIRIFFVFWLGSITLTRGQGTGNARSACGPARDTNSFSGSSPDKKDRSDQLRSSCFWLRSRS